MSYAAFLERKRRTIPPAGLNIDPAAMHPSLFAFQRDLVAWAAGQGRAAIWADTGMGKTRMQLEWAKAVGGRTIILAPLVVAQQTVREAEAIGMDLAYSTHPGETRQFTITNYERAENFDAADFDAVVLDESSILKNYAGATRTALIDQWASVDYRLCCTATPAPNDITELANHSEFLGVMPRNEMLAAFFVHDDDGWRVKGHAWDALFTWMAGWARAVRRPSDVGHPEEDGLYDLPPLTYKQHVVPTIGAPDGQLFAVDLGGVGGRAAVRKQTLTDRVKLTAALVNDDDDEPWIVWCGLNDEAEALARLIPGSVNVQGSDNPESKTDALVGFVDGRVRVLITKPSIAGFGMNFQHCARMAFTGLSDSYESYYQAVRRCWRFGQPRPVEVHIVVSELEQQIVANVERKSADAERMTSRLVEAMNQENR